MTAAQISRVQRNSSKAEPLKAGDYVYLWVPSIPRGAIKKLTLRWHGPYQIIDRQSHRKFTIKTLRGNRIVHEHRIRKSWADEAIEINKDEDAEFEDLLDNSGRVLPLNVIVDKARVVYKSGQSGNRVTFQIQEWEETDPIASVSLSTLQRCVGRLHSMLKP